MLPNSRQREMTTMSRRHTAHPEEQEAALLRRRSGQEVVCQLPSHAGLREARAAGHRFA